MTLQQDFILLQDWDRAIELTGKSVISLTPEVSCQLTFANLSYQIPEDFYSEKELRAGEDSFFFEQLEQFNRFDALIQSYVGYCKHNNVMIARLCFNRFKYFLDSVILQCLILDKIVEKISKANGNIF